MPKKCYTALDIKNLADQKILELRLQKGEMITALAREKANELGVLIIENENEIHHPQPSSAISVSISERLEAQVRRIVSKVLSQEAPSPSSVERPPTRMANPSLSTTIVTEAQLRHQIRHPQKGMSIELPADARLSPSAQDFLKEWNMAVVIQSPPAPQPPVRNADSEPKKVEASSYAQIRFRSKLDTLHSLFLLIGALARKEQKYQLADLLKTLATYCREISSAQANQRGVAPLQLDGKSNADLRKITLNPKESLGIDHIVPGPQDAELLLWLNYLHMQVREAEVTALEAFKTLESRSLKENELASALNGLSNAVYYLELSLAAGKLAE